MDKDERKRLDRLQKDIGKGFNSAALEKITVTDLLLLLQHDHKIRSIIQGIVSISSDAVTGGSEGVHTSAGKVPCAPNPEMLAAYDCQASFSLPSVIADSLRDQLAPELSLLSAVLSDDDLAHDWLCNDELEGRQLIRLIARASQWDVLSDLWERFAARCKRDRRAVTATELNILQSTLAVHNLRWQGREATLIDVVVGVAYDYRLHQRGISTRETVRALWLPGLVNAGGELHKKPLVET